MEIVYQDSNLIVINKPPGISVHGGNSVSGPTVADFLKKEFPETTAVGDEPNVRPGIVHRLDKNTSGIMVIARNQKTFETIKELFQKRLVEKTYLAIVCGTPKEKKGIISLAVGRLAKNSAKRGAEEKPGMIKNPREAITHYRVLKTGEKFSLVELTPKTGRMHQIRIHLKALGHPVACDTIYGGKNVCCPTDSTRHMLHARSLLFSIGGKRFFFETDPPTDFQLAKEKII